ncbi:TetR family transcriptional regulator [Mycolicibacterium sp.]|uniref:TetR/AcrR family transcriptional regulator n=1 Tax=Mycolicibacterium sp. TaxID=2320850 RepID=UPI001A2684B3|nr:TetR family transcriptional regulator [Mycolicibacterium sp.]MBJ7336556.1 TetR family transcriptional regulator [Mycolicibacterium sp.]
MARPRNQGARRQALIEATYTAGHKHGLRSLSLTDVAQQAGLSRGTVLYYYDDLDALLVEAHSAGVERFCDERDRMVDATDDPRKRLDIAITAGLPSGPDDALMRILYEFDVLAGNSALHDDLVQRMYLRQTNTYRGIFDAGRQAGVFTPALSDDVLAMNFVALEDAYGLHIVAGNALVTVESAASAMRAVASELGCPPSS